MQILAVVVLYNRLPERSQTIRSLAAQLERDPELLKSISVLIWDNGPARVENANLPFPFDYRWSGRNIGVSGAYNRAAELADLESCPWLLLLDQDTSLPDNFLARMLDYSRSVANAERVAAVAPFARMHDKEVFFSPMKLGFLDRGQRVPRTFDGIDESDAVAINSGMLLRLRALQEIGGYNEDFWLDLSDFYLFYQLHRAGWRLYIAGDLEIRHNCAMMDYAAEMSAERYRAFSYAEDAYLSLYKSRVENVAQPLRLLVRTWRQYSRYDDKAFSRISLQFFFRRIFKTKARRLRAWRENREQREMLATPHPQAARLSRGEPQNPAPPSREANSREGSLLS